VSAFDALLATRFFKLPPPPPDAVGGQATQPYPVTFRLTNPPPLYDQSLARKWKLLLPLPKPPFRAYKAYHGQPAGRSLCVCPLWEPSAHEQAPPQDTYILTTSRKPVNYPDVYHFGELFLAAGCAVPAFMAAGPAVAHILVGPNQQGRSSMERAYILIIQG